jgi:hypothetical protein
MSEDIIPEYLWHYTTPKGLFGAAFTANTDRNALRARPSWWAIWNFYQALEPRHADRSSFIWYRVYSLTPVAEYKNLEG